MNKLNSPHMIVDGRNLMYRAIFANCNNQGKRYHHFTVMLRFLHTWVAKFKPSSVSVCWDSKKSTLWRKAIYPGYKDRDHTKYKTDIRQDLIYTELAAKAILKYMNVRQLSKVKQEADDLIYSSCYVLAPYPVVVISTDKDMHQLPFRMDHVTLYEPLANKIIPKPMIDPVILKALAGDESDTIGGYEQIGPVRGTRLAESHSDLVAFLQARGQQIYVRNRLLIDLSLNPNALANNLYCFKKLIEPTVFDKKIINELARQHRVNGLIAEYSNIVAPFKMLSEQLVEEQQPVETV